MAMKSPFTDIPTAIDEMRAGRMVVVVDDEDRENEGDLTMAAEKITPEAVNFMARFGRGLICLAMTPDRLDHLGLRPMARHNTSRFSTAFTESIDALTRGVTTGISAYDRAETIRCAIDPAIDPAELGRPGHVFPLRAQPGGVLVRPGQTEAAVDLTRLAGMTPAGVICEIMNDDGTMARVPDLMRFCHEHELKMITVAELIRYRMDRECAVYRTGIAVLPTEFGDFSMVTYASDMHEDFHVALICGDPAHSMQLPLIRLQPSSEGGAVRAALRRIADAGTGVWIGLRSQAPDLSLYGKGESDAGVEDGEEIRILTFENEFYRPTDLFFAARILRDLGVSRIRLLANRSEPAASLILGGVEIPERVSFALRKPRTMPRLAERMPIGAD